MSRTCVALASGARVVQFECHLEVGDGVRGEHRLESVHRRQDVGAQVLRPVAGDALRGRVHGRFRARMLSQIGGSG